MRVTIPFCIQLKQPHDRPAVIHAPHTAWRALQPKVRGGKLTVPAYCGARIFPAGSRWFSRQVGLWECLVQMDFQDKNLKCVDCGAEFVFTAGEQVFFHDKQFKNEPKRCKGCKAKRVALVGGGSHSSSLERRRRQTVRSAGRRRQFRFVPHRDVRCCVASVFSKGIAR